MEPAVPEPDFTPWRMIASTKTTALVRASAREWYATAATFASVHVMGPSGAALERWNQLLFPPVLDTGAWISKVSRVDVGAAGVLCMMLVVEATVFTLCIRGSDSPSMSYSQPLRPWSWSLSSPISFPLTSPPCSTSHCSSTGAHSPQSTNSKSFNLGSSWLHLGRCLFHPCRALRPPFPWEWLHASPWRWLPWECPCSWLP
mmetsp:Transcript_21862/g.67060  ORF Transcript_21862/g.67060 Transcript_21862/m.67060 type:complete len:202 (-) Transcript_21862:590-1195(-)